MTAAVAAARLLRLRPPSALLPRHHRLQPITSVPIVNISRALYSTSSSSFASVDDSPAAHPWPEWDRFLDKLRSKGYFNKISEGAADGESDAIAASSMDMNRVKNACLSFARERFDLIGSLCREDMHAVVESGCPNLYRKAVNSAKRLRAFLKLDEGDVCNGCNLRGSCDKAYVIAKDDEGARTVDVIRILLYYAIDPALTSGGDNPLNEQVQASARNLLSKLSELSETTIDPSLPKPVVVAPREKELAKKTVNTVRQSPNVEMKRGDWLCPRCNFLNFARNIRCLECKEDGPKRVDLNSFEMKHGDWTCPQCQFMNFARNKKCHRCQESRPKRELNPGEWECPSCDFVNFRRNMVCRKCNSDRPKENDMLEGHEWAKPDGRGRGGTTVRF